jgi:hypothetical protein
VLPAKYGDYMMVTRDERNRRWWLNERPFALAGRNAGLRTSRDLIHWSDPEPVFVNTPDMGFGRLYEWHGGITPFNYGNQNLGLLEKWCNAGFGDNCELVSNRDGQPWQRVLPGSYFLEVGPEGDFDRVLIYPTHNAPIRVGNKLHIYYSGGGPKLNPRRGMPMNMGLATISLDRFAALAHVRGPAGELLTRPIEISRPHLEVNAELLHGGGVALELLNPDGTVIPGYSMEDSTTDISGEGPRFPVRWKTKPDLSELIGRRVWPKFRVTGAALYSYRFADSTVDG